ncbi:MAG: hypothetical protein RMJ84_07325 [Sandaracinaceae bacterium]|nr:hypothetical protein [Sandaracinaceae bacterium]
MCVFLDAGVPDASISMDAGPRDGGVPSLDTPPLMVVDAGPPTDSPIIIPPPDAFISSDAHIQDASMRLDSPFVDAGPPLIDAGLDVHISPHQDAGLDALGDAIGFCGDGVCAFGSENCVTCEADCRCPVGSFCNPGLQACVPVADGGFADGAPGNDAFVESDAPVGNDAAFGGDAEVADRDGDLAPGEDAVVSPDASLNDGGAPDAGPQDQRDGGRMDAGPSLPGLPPPGGIAGGACGNCRAAPSAPSPFVVWSILALLSLGWWRHKRRK